MPIARLDAPIDIDAAPGARRLLFVAERQGTISVLRGERPLRRPFLDVSDLVQAGRGEQGFLAIAFAPDYERSRRLYAYFTNNDGNIEVDEFKRSRREPTRAPRRTRRKVIEIPHPRAAHHNGGGLAFGPDGFLYLATGDGSDVNDAFDNARDPASLLGKLLRIDPTAAGRRYRSPADNPYAGEPGRDEIYAYGFRNPWRISFHRDRIAIGDVGEHAVEEIDIATLAAARGANFGWPQYEGSQEMDPSRPGADPPLFPIHEYPNEGRACAVTAGDVVRDRDLPDLRGRFLYADFCAGQLRSFVPDLASGEAFDDAPHGIRIPAVSAFGEGPSGDVYVASLEGRVFKLEP